MMTQKTSKVGQSDLFIVVRSVLISMPVDMQDYKSLYAAAVVCVTLVNIQIPDRHTVTQTAF